MHIRMPCVISGWRYCRVNSVLFSSFHHLHLAYFILFYFINQIMLDSDRGSSFFHFQLKQEKEPCLPFNMAIMARQESVMRKDVEAEINSENDILVSVMIKVTNRIVL